jgi:hypothetical protein
MLCWKSDFARICNDFSVFFRKRAMGVGKGICLKLNAINAGVKSAK